MSDTTDKKNAAFLLADLDRSALGLRSRLADDLAGKCVLRRTLERLLQARQLHEIIVFCPTAQAQRVSALTAGLDVQLVGLEHPIPLSPHVRRRKWALASWRGGLREATVFDEQPVTPEMVLALRDRQVYTALAVPPEAVLLNPALVDGLIAYHHEHGQSMRFTFTQAPPGLIGCAYRLDLLHELVQARLGVGDLLAYDPDGPHGDYIVHECNFPVPRELATARLRCLADTARSFRLLDELYRRHGPGADDWDAVRLVATLGPLTAQLGPLPEEIELELNTAPSLRMPGYPHRRDDLARGPLSADLCEKIARDAAACDDVCLTLGGCGEPLAHPDLPALIAAAHAAGIFALNIETDGQALAGPLADALADSPADTFSVFLDANTPELYARLKGADHFDRLVRQLEAFAARTRARGGPTLVPHLTKTADTLDEMEAFYDRWLRAAGAAVILGYNDFAGQIPDQAVMDMQPPCRFPCLRLARRLTILADGRATLCSQDFSGRYAFASAADHSLADLWRHPALDQVRLAHAAGNFTGNELCARCKEWHR